MIKPEQRRQRENHNNDMFSTQGKSSEHEAHFMVRLLCSHTISLKE